jgi:hypothetical protein
LEHGDSSGSTDSETDSVDRRVADLREVALKLVSRRAGTPWRNEAKESVHRSARRPEDSNTDPNSYMHEQPPHAPQETAVDPTHEESRNKDSDDIWFKYVFSDTNTDDLHKQVLAEAGKNSAGNLLQGQTNGEDRDRITGSEMGHNLSTAATHGQPSIGTTETGNDLTSAVAVSSSHSAAIRSASTTQTAGTVSDEWEGSGGHPYAAPSMQGSMTSGITYPAQPDGNDSGSTSGQGTSQVISDITSSFSSKAVEPPRSIAENASTKENFIFAPPKLFVGRLSESVASDRPVVALKPVTLTKPKRGRPKRKARDGRASIKSIPMYHDDPIEDFEELEAQAWVEPSLFGALTME